MAKLVISYYVSVDGRSVTPDNGLREIMNDIDDPEQEAYYVDQLWEAGAFLMGRNSYEAMKGFWPSTDHPSAPAMNQIPKIVFSRTLTAADPSWPAEIVSGDTAAEITRRKDQPGKDLVACAGDEFLRSLIAAGVVDEYRLWVLPAAAGTGTELFPDRGRPERLRLLSSRAFASGILELVYAATA